jgi:predicted DNA-binding protein YlxM (UPF0122 family)
MTITTSNKKGGRYTKKQQEERKIQVYQLHFCEEKSAVEIAKLLNVNRNTINDDIAYWYRRIGNQTNVKDIPAKIASQILLLHTQRDRMLEYLEDDESMSGKIKIERFIFDIDNKLTSIYSKMLDNHREFPIKTKADYSKVSDREITADTVKEFVMYLISSHDKSDSNIVYSENELITNFIMLTQYDVPYANRVIEKMMRYGLSQCIDPKHDQFGASFYTPEDTSKRYTIKKFALMRKIICNDDKQKEFQIS